MRAALDQLDACVFTGGVGEHAPRSAPAASRSTPMPTRPRPATAMRRRDQRLGRRRPHLRGDRPRRSRDRREIRLFCVSRVRAGQDAADERRRPPSCSSTVHGTAVGAGIPCGNGCTPTVSPPPSVDNPSVTRTRLRPRRRRRQSPRRRSTRSTGPVLLVGHSYGGAVISDAGRTRTSASRVSHRLPARRGESVAQNALLGGEEMKLGEVMQFGDDGQVSVDPARGRRVLLPRLPGRCGGRGRRPPAPDVDGGHDRASPGQSRGARNPRPTSCAPTTVRYPLRCNARPRRGSATSSEMPTSHSPFLSRPDELAALLIELAAR